MYTHLYIYIYTYIYICIYIYIYIYIKHTKINTWINLEEDGAAAETAGIVQEAHPAQHRARPIPVANGLSVKAENRGVVVTEAGSYPSLVDSGMPQFEAQGPSRTCNESKEEATRAKKKHPYTLHPAPCTLHWNRRLALPPRVGGEHNAAPPQPPAQQHPKP